MLGQTRSTLTRPYPLVSVAGQEDTKPLVKIFYFGHTNGIMSNEDDILKQVGYSFWILMKRFMYKIYAT